VVLGNPDLADKLGVVGFDRFSFGNVLSASLVSFSAFFRSRAALQLEILALRHQLGVLQRSVKRPKLRPADRLLWAWLCGVWRTGNPVSSSSKRLAARADPLPPAQPEDNSFASSDEEEEVNDTEE
jgi:hypothetical protein